MTSFTISYLSIDKISSQTDLSTEREYDFKLLFELIVSLMNQIGTDSIRELMGKILRDDNHFLCFSLCLCDFEGFPLRTKRSTYLKPLGGKKVTDKKFGSLRHY